MCIDFVSDLLWELEEHNLAIVMISHIGGLQDQLLNDCGGGVWMLVSR